MQDYSTTSLRETTKACQDIKKYTMNSTGVWETWITSPVTHNIAITDSSPCKWYDPVIYQLVAITYPFSTLSYVSVSYSLTALTAYISAVTCLAMPP
jgi:hypothetical protein